MNQTADTSRPGLVFWVTFSTVFFAVALAYAPGLSGPFLFDDFVNLNSLGAFGPVDNLQTLLFYLTSGVADPTGRPVAVASFLIDARNWPADPFAFKRTNLILHLVNGALLIGTVARLESRLSMAGRSTPLRRQHYIALLSGFLWLAHPLFVSTTLYAVQRHAMLPLTFALVAILCWDRAFERHLAGKFAAGWFWGLGGVGAATLLAGLSKANGFLTPLLICVAVWVFYVPLMRQQATPIRRRLQQNAVLALVIPGLIVVAAILSRAPSSFAYSGLRSFSLGERLLSQPRALLDYLNLLVLPRAGGGGVFVEGFHKSTTIWDPWTTLPSIVAVVALISGSVLLRRRFPRLTFALLFFFVGHLMESSVIMLELYFEHRNYLPAAFLFWPLGSWLLNAHQLRRVRQLIVVVAPVLLLFLTFQRALIWGDPAVLASISAANNPDSQRAQIVAATSLADAGKLDAATDLLRDSIQRLGPTTELSLNLVGLECRNGKVSKDTVSMVNSALSRERRWHKGLIAWLAAALDIAAKGSCQGLDLAAARGFLTVAEANVANQSQPSRLQNLIHLQALHALFSGSSSEALKLFNRALQVRPNPDTALTQAAIFGRLGFASEGTQHLDFFETLPDSRPRRIRSMQDVHQTLIAASGYYQVELDHMRAMLAADSSSRTGTRSGRTEEEPTIPSKP